MVVGYDCSNCGYKHECDTDSTGERICPDCGDAVTGITGNLRGDSDLFNVEYRTTANKRLSTAVVATTVDEAYRRAKEEATGVSSILSIDRLD